MTLRPCSRSTARCERVDRKIRSAALRRERPTSSAGCPRRTGSTAAVTVLALGRSRRRAAPLLYGWRAWRVHRLRLRGSRGDTITVSSMHFVSRGETGLVQRVLRAEGMLARLCAPWDNSAAEISAEEVRGGARLERGAAGGGGAWSSTGRRLRLGPCPPASARSGLPSSPSGSCRRSRLPFRQTRFGSRDCIR